MTKVYLYYDTETLLERSDSASREGNIDGYRYSLTRQSYIHRPKICIIEVHICFKILFLKPPHI